LIIGKQNQTAIGTLVERQTGYTMLLHLPDGYQPEQARDVLAAEIKTLPNSLRLSLSWDQGPQMRECRHVSIDAGIDIYLCDPHSPWQHGTNENTNGLLRQYFPERHRPQRAQRRRPRLGRPRTQRPTSQTTSVQQADRTHRRPAVAMTARIRRSFSGTRRE